MANRFINPVPSFRDGNDAPITDDGSNAAGLWFYVTGTSTPATTYSDNTLSTANENPVTCDSRGEPDTEIFLDPAVTYKVVLKDVNGNTIWTRDPVVDPAANVTAALQVYAGDPNGNVAGNAGTVGGAGASMIYDITNNLIYVCTTSGTASTAVWTQQGASLAGQITRTGVISPAQITSNQNDYEPTGISTASMMRLNSDATREITGIADPGTDGVLMTIANVGSFNIILRDDDGNSTAANRFAFDADVVLLPDTSISLRYDETSSRWRAQDGAVAALGGQIKLTGVVSPSQITGDQNDYNPTDLDIGSVLRISSDAAHSITGITAQPAGTFLAVVNTGSFNITLVDSSGSSSGSNRFDFDANIVLRPDAGILLYYEGTSSRWRTFSGALPPNLADIIGLAVTDGNFIVGNGSNLVAESGNTARASLGLGTGDTVRFEEVNIGHASDTTITRVSGGGDIQVEGHPLYREGGTDVPVSDGGTGASSASSARSNLGLGTLATKEFTDLIYTGSTEDNPSFPVGAQVLCADNANRNSAQTVYLSSTNSYEFSGTTSLSGTWRASGSAAAATATLMRRTA